jgi:hypothetical protein
MSNERAEWYLKLLLRAFGGTSALAIFAFVMPWSWMGVVHEWLGMGTLPNKPVVEYLARATSALCAFYGGLLLLLATNVRQYGRVITFQAIAMMVISAVGACLGLRAGMPAWWMIGDASTCWICCGAMLWLQKRMDSSEKCAGRANPNSSVL